MNLYLVIVGIIVCVCLSAFFSAAEMSYSSCNPLRLERLRDEGSKRAGAAVRITEHYDDALSAILIGNNLVNIAASSLGSVFVILITGRDDNTWLSTVIITLLIITFGETIPKITAKKCANNVAVRDSYIITALMFILKPIIWLVVSVINLITRGMKGDGGDDAEEAVEELQSIIETAEDEDVLDEDQSELLQAAIGFADISAFEVMTARVDVQDIDIDDDWDDILSII